MVKEVELPDGTIAEFPDHMPDSEIEGVLQRQFMQSLVPPTKEPDVPRETSRSATPFDVMAAINRGASLGLSEMAIPAATAGFKALTEGAPFAETYASEKAGRARAASEIPGSVNLAGEVAGGTMLGPVMAARQGMLNLATKHPFLSSIVSGAGYGGVYGGATAPAGEALPGAARGAGAGAVAGPLGYGLARGAQGAIAAIRRGRTPKPSRIFQRDVLDPAGMGIDEVTDAMRVSGPGTTVLEATGVPGTRMAQAVTGRSPAAAQRLRNVIDQRLKGKWDRLQGDIRRLLGKEGSKFHREFKQIGERRSAQASPHYTASRDDFVPESSVQEYMDYIKDQAATYEGTSIGNGLNKISRLLTKTRGKEKVLKTNVGVELHATKMQLDDMIETAKRQGQGNRARVLMDAKTKLLAMMDEASPNYQTARNLFSGDSDVMNAMELGRKVLREDAEITGMMLERMSQAEKDAYLVGAAKALRDAAGTKPPQSFYRHGGIRERLAFAFPDEKSLDEFVNVSLTREAKLGELSTKILHGAQTQPRQRATQNLTMAIEDLAEGQQSAATSRVIRFFQMVKGDYSENVIKELTDLLVEDRPEVFAEKASKVLRPEDFEVMRRMFTTTGTVIGAEQAAGGFQ